VRKISGLVESDPLFHDLAFDPKVVGALQQILGPELKLMRNTVLCKPPGDAAPRPPPPSSSCCSSCPPPPPHAVNAAASSSMQFVLCDQRFLSIYSDQRFLPIYSDQRFLPMHVQAE
jgi:hypothetical protein